MKINHNLNCQCVACKAKRGEYKGFKNPNFKDGRTNKIYCCKEKNCNNKICRQTALYGQGKCSICSHKNENNGMFGKHHTLIGRNNISNNKIGMKHTKAQKLARSKWMTGKTHIERYGIEQTKRIQKSQSKRMAGKNNPMFGKRGKLSHRFGKISHGKHIKYNNIWMLSSWEVLFAQFLDLSNIKWMYEPKTFDLGNTTYTTDFYLPEFDCYIEIKGFWRDDAKEKFDRFKQRQPEKNIKLFMKKELQILGIL